MVEKLHATMNGNLEKLGESARCPSVCAGSEASPRAPAVLSYLVLCVPPWPSPAPTLRVSAQLVVFLPFCAVLASGGAMAKQQAQIVALERQVDRLVGRRGGGGGSGGGNGGSGGGGSEAVEITSAGESVPLTAQVRARPPAAVASSLLAAHVSRR
jgi:uncharacterized membrane protein YgcG